MIIILVYSTFLINGSLYLNISLYLYNNYMSYLDPSRMMTEKY